MKKPKVVSQIEKILEIELHPAPTRQDDPLGGLIPYKKNTPKYSYYNNKLIGMNLANLSLTDEQWNAIIDLEDFFPKHVEALNLWKNQLTAFRSEWGFDNLTYLDLDENPLRYPQEEITSKGNAAILNFLKELQKGEIVVYEAKILILGESGVGKTTLARKLRNPKSKMPDQEDTTKGIEVSPHIIQEPGKPDFTMHIWDFGGQEIYHSTHQFFLSKRSLYVLVLDGRLDEDPHYWMQVQDLLGEKSPILILLNKKVAVRQQLAFQELLGLYPNLQTPLSFFSLKSEKDEVIAFNELVANQIRNLPHFKEGEKVPRKWAKVRKKLNEIGKKENYISLEKFREVCREEDIKEEERQDFISDFLHSLGVILHFNKVPFLKKIVILNPTWATGAVYKVLDHTRNFAEVEGHFHRDELDNIWSIGGYKGVFDEMLALMKKFELCYEIPYKPNEFIVPQLLSPDKPTYKWEEKKQIKLHYRYTFMPKGIVTRLIVRLHRYIKDHGTVWQRGAIFENERAKAEVIELYHNRSIFIKVNGLDRKALMTIITHHIDEINSTFDFDERLKVNQLIPCNCSTCKNEVKGYFFPKEVLLNARSLGRINLECQKSFKDVSIADLFDDTFANAIIESRPSKIQDENTILNYRYIFHGPVGSVNPDNKGRILQRIDQQNLFKELQTLKQLIEIENKKGFITRDEYLELIEILEEIKEDHKNPKDRQKNRWIRWIEKVSDKGHKFLGGRIEKATDSAIQEEVKTWIKEGGLEVLIESLRNL